MCIHTYTYIAEMSICELKRSAYFLNIDSIKVHCLHGFCPHFMVQKYDMCTHTYIKLVCMALTKKGEVSLWLMVQKYDTHTCITHIKLILTVYHLKLSAHFLKMWYTYIHVHIHTYVYTYIKASIVDLSSQALCALLKNVIYIHTCTYIHTCIHT